MTRGLLLFCLTAAPAFAGPVSATVEFVKFVTYREGDAMRDRFLRETGVQYRAPNVFEDNAGQGNAVVSLRDSTRREIPGVRSHGARGDHGVAFVDPQTGTAAGFALGRAIGENRTLGFVQRPGAETVWIKPLAGDVASRMFQVTADGKAGLGMSRDRHGSERPFYWTAEGGAVAVPMAPGALFAGPWEPNPPFPRSFQATGLSADGRTVVGTVPESHYPRRVEWSPDGGFRVDDRPWAAAGLTSPAGVSVHMVQDPLEPKATLVRTEANGATRELAEFWEGASFHPHWLSADGKTLLGVEDTDPGYNNIENLVVVFTEDGKKSLEQWLIDEHGVPAGVFDNHYLRDIRGVSADGRQLWGYGGPRGSYMTADDSAFLLTFGDAPAPTPEPASWAAFGMVVGVAAWRRRGNRPAR